MCFSVMSSINGLNDNFKIKCHILNTQADRLFEFGFSSFATITRNNMDIIKSSSVLNLESKIVNVQMQILTQLGDSKNIEFSFEDSDYFIYNKNDISILIMRPSICNVVCNVNGYSDMEFVLRDFDYMKFSLLLAQIY